jgi:choline dehydrogenase-like flavoprotein
MDLGARGTLRMAQRYDVIIVGAGHNGLVAAFYLARARRSVLVLERGAIVGGACVTEEIHPIVSLTLGSVGGPPRIASKITLYIKCLSAPSPDRGSGGRAFKSLRPEHCSSG